MEISKMKTLILSCPTLKGELESALRQYGSQAKVIYLPATLHGEIQKIRPTLQGIIDGNKEFERIVILLSGCGGSTAGLRATTAELVIPKTHDCLDILLADKDTCQVAQRDVRGIYMTGSWYYYHMQTLLNADKLVEEMGYEAAAVRLRSIFGSFNQFYIIDTGVFDIAAIQQGLASLVKILDGSVRVVTGGYGFLRKLAADAVTAEYFYITPKGGHTKVVPYRLDEEIK